MKKKIVLIRPWNEFYQNNYPPLNLILIGTVLKNNGFEVKIIHCEDKDQWQEKINKELDEQVLAVGITTLTSEIAGAIDIAAYLRNQTKAPVIWGGWHVSLFPEQMENSDLVDYAITGEGDFTFLKLVLELANNKRPTNKIIYSERLNLDLLPLPDYELDPEIESYISGKLTDKFQQYLKERYRWLPYQASRGCPHRCSFCINVVTNNTKYKTKAVDKVLDELEYLVKQFKLTHIKFIDDNFFARTNFAKDVAAGIIERKLKFSWDSECRVDYFKPGRIDEQAMQLFKDSGLVQFTFGIESGSKQSLDTMKKDITPEQVIQAVAMADKFDIVVRGSFILDVPGDTKEDLYQTVKLISKLRKFKKFTCGVHTYRPYPKSELCQHLIEQGLIKQPTTLAEWTYPEYVHQYTSTYILRKWQKNYKLSSKISFYQSLESAMWLKPYQIDSKIIWFINSMFIGLAKIRNRIRFYAFPFEKPIYIRFKDWYYKMRLKGKERIC